MSVLCPRPGVTPLDDDLDPLFNCYCDLSYLRLVSALARNSIWHPHLIEHRHVDHCIGMIAKCHKPSFVQLYSCLVVGILLRITPEQLSVTSRWSVAKEQWWDMIRRGWMNFYSVRWVQDADADELLPVLVKVTKKYIQISSKPDLVRLIKDVDRVLRGVEQRGLECADDLKELGLQPATYFRGSVNSYLPRNILSVS
ncbi:hypothetical protein DEU56DRAFT_419981 [Suillus clintonianus]|uniref:uncharacterized protein n=1 Tax=Suillus clintonianus TaxID=1904413 RepID=UPI001B87F3E5|nr:uncharacterized protein DEU56DRAFT_419981 [Suillus clintonianus]KAG2133333.1 hypothetical protein DEU56DRAFT_419981 [Suillus clintonianus]